MSARPTATRAPQKKPAKKAAAPPTVLAGDVGGTRTRLALYALGGRKPLAESIVRSGEHAGLEEIVAAFLAASGVAHPVAAVFGVAGPVKAGTARITNLPWKLDERALARRLRIGAVGLVNDLAAGARGCLEVRPAELTVLTATAPVKKGAHLGVLAAGTGLGEARLIWAGGRYHALPTEGGHTDFAPRSALEVELWQFLAARHPDHLSYERVVSGAGLGAIYDFFVTRAGGDPPDVAAQLAVGDRNAVICALGITGAHPAAAQAVDLFARIYGAEAGNVALRELSLGGVYVLGNIGATILPARRDVFLEGFLAKGRFRELLSAVPIAVVRDPLVGLRGAHALAEELAEG